MSNLQRLRMIVAGCTAAMALVACGGGGSDSTSAIGSSTPAVATDTGNAGGSSGGATTVTADANAPALTGDIATDGVNWFNFRRGQLGLSQLTRNSLIDQAALGHSNYQKLNPPVSHNQVAGKIGFTGVDLEARLAQAGYVLTPRTGFAYGEVISGTNNKSGVFMAEELITAIYHRFVVFEPVFKELGGGAATNASGYTYFTTDFGAINGTGAGIDGVVVWPFNGQTGIAPSFLTDNEEPDAIIGQNEAGYPVSVHANINGTVTVTSFTIRPRGGSELSAKLLTATTDPQYTRASVAAIVPYAPLKAATTYDVSFVGNVSFKNGVGGTPVTRSWSFTTK